MITQNELADSLGISTMTVRNRAKELELEKMYQSVPGNIGTNARVFTDDEAEMIKNYTGRKPGRKAKDE